MHTNVIMWLPFDEKRESHGQLFLHRYFFHSLIAYAINHWRGGGKCYTKLNKFLLWRDFYEKESISHYRPITNNVVGIQRMLEKRLSDGLSFAECVIDNYANASAGRQLDDGSMIPFYYSPYEECSHKIPQ